MTLFRIGNPTQCQCVITDVLNAHLYEMPPEFVVINPRSACASEGYSSCFMCVCLSGSTKSASTCI